MRVLFLFAKQAHSECFSPQFCGVWDVVSSVRLFRVVSALKFESKQQSAAELHEVLVREES